jgi:hypothetical protein
MRKAQYLQEEITWQIIKGKGKVKGEVVPGLS